MKPQSPASPVKPRSLIARIKPPSAKPPSLLVRLTLSSLGLDKLNLAAGALVLWVAVAPWLWGYASSSSAVASHVFFIFAFGPLTLLIVVLRPAAFVMLAAGLWLAFSPWLLGYGGNHTAWLSDLATGLLLSMLAWHATGLSIKRLRRVGKQRRRPATGPLPLETVDSRS
jgi:SPW repeat